jgi:hypothetical protein
MKRLIMEPSPASSNRAWFQGKGRYFQIGLRSAEQNSGMSAVDRFVECLFTSFPLVKTWLQSPLSPVSLPAVQAGGFMRTAIRVSRTCITYWAPFSPSNIVVLLLIQVEGTAQV